MISREALLQRVARDVGAASRRHAEFEPGRVLAMQIVTVYMTGPTPRVLEDSVGQQPIVDCGALPRCGHALRPVARQRVLGEATAMPERVVQLRVKRDGRQGRVDALAPDRTRIRGVVVRRPVAVLHQGCARRVGAVAAPQHAPARRHKVREPHRLLPPSSRRQRQVRRKTVTNINLNYTSKQNGTEPPPDQPLARPLSP